MHNKVVYQLALDDHIAWNHWWAESMPNYKSQLLCGRISAPLLFMGPIVLLILYALSHERDPAQIYIGYFMIAMLLVGGIYIFWNYPVYAKKGREKCIRNIYRDGKGEGTMFGRYSLEIVDDKLIEKTPNSETSKRISSLYKIAELPDHVVIMPGPSEAFVIPRKKVEEGDLESFVLELKKKMPHTEVK